MSTLLLFVMLLLLSFGVIVWVLRPSKGEHDIQRHLRNIGNLTSPDSIGTSIVKQESLSSIPWVNRALELLPGTMYLHRFMVQAGSKWSVGALLLGSLALGPLLAVGAALLTSSLALALSLGLIGGCSPFVYLILKRTARFRRIDMLLPGAVDLISRAMRAGHSVASAIEVVSEETPDPLRAEFRVVFEQQNLGLPLREALLNLVNRIPVDDVRFLVTAILVQKETGGNLAEIMDKAGAVMRERMRLKGQLQIYTAQARVTGWVLGLLPFIVFVLINFANHDYEKRLWTDPLGLRILIAGAAMMALGVFAIRKIIDIKV
jgi:tight adherence protein B